MMNKKTIYTSVIQKGFTLLEMTIYMAIFTLLLTVLMQIFTSILNVQSVSEATSHVEQDGRFLLARLMYDINRTQSITTPATLGEETNTLQITIDGIINTYNLVGNNLILTNNNGSNQLNGLLTSISNLTFKRIGNIAGKNTIQIKFTVTSTRQDIKPEIRNYQTSVGIR